VSASRIRMSEFITVNGVALSDMPPKEARAWVIRFERNTTLLERILEDRSGTEPVNGAIEAAMNNPKFATADWAEFGDWFKQFQLAPWLLSKPSKV